MMKKPADDDTSRFERIHSKANERREGVKARKARAKKGRCYKQAYARKQALTQCNALLSEGAAPYLRTYKCWRCNHWHLTHQPPRNRGSVNGTRETSS